MKNVVPIRKGLGIRTAFNLLGPLLNPAGAARQVIGVFDPALMGLMAETLRRLGTDHALVVHGCGLDELTPVGVAQAIEVTPEGVREISIDPSDYGFDRCTVHDLKGGTAAENAEALRRSLGGEQGAVADALAFNTGAALYVYGTAESLGDGVARARETQRSGEALSVLERWAAASQAVRQENSR